MAPLLSKEDWKAQLGPLLSTSLQSVSERITRTEEVQEWLRRASANAAEHLETRPGRQGEMDGYLQMKNALKDRFPELCAAIGELTGGCGQVDLDWTPMNPSLSRVEVTFDYDFSIDLFLQLGAPTREAARKAIHTVADALPSGPPFPNRPNAVTGLVAYDGSCLGIRVREHLQDDRQGQYRTVTLLSERNDPVENLSVTNAADRLLQALVPPDSSSGD